MANNDTIEKIKQDASIVDIALDAGLLKKRVSISTAIHCLFHEPDRNPSLVIMPDVNRYECKSCGAKGDIIDFYAHINNCSVGDAIRALGGNDYKTHKPVVKITPEDYLTKHRGFTPDTIRRFNLAIVEYYGQKAIKISLPHGTKYRFINPKDGKRYKHNAGTRNHLFKTASAAPSVVLCEGEFDAMSGYQLTNGAMPFWTATTGKHLLSSSAMIAESLTREGMEDGDDEDYVEYCRRLQEAARQVIDAAKQQDYAKARQAAGAMKQSCDACHELYRA